MSFRASVILVLVGSVMASSSCFALALLDGLPQIPTTAYARFGAGAGVLGIVVGALVLLAVVGAFGRQQDSSVPRARRRGGNEAAGPRGTNGGGPAAQDNNATEVLPAVEAAEASTAVFSLPLWAGRADSPRGSGRPTIQLRAVAGVAGPPARMAGGFDEGWEPPAHKPARAPARGGAARMTVAAPASGNSGAATTLTLPSAADPQPAGVPQRAYHRSAARGDAAHAVTRLAGVGRPTPPTTWTGGTAVNSAALDETFHR